MLKRILIIAGWILVIAFIALAVIVVQHDSNLERYNKLAQCHGLDGILVEEVETGEYYCLPKEKVKRP